MKIALGFDHAGIAYKPAIIEYLEQNGHTYHDYGTYTTESCNYADYGYEVAKAVASNQFDFGVLVCGTGIGISITANKVPGIRCANCADVFSAIATRQHNNANVIAFGQRTVGEGLMLLMLDKFLNTQFEGGRHQTRIDKIAEIERLYNK